MIQYVLKKFPLRWVGLNIFSSVLKLVYLWLWEPVNCEYINQDPGEIVLNSDPFILCTYWRELFMP